jgi:hypothetical protein
VQPQYPTIHHLGTEVLTVTMSKPAYLREYLKERAWSFPVVCDPDLEAYRHFGLERISWWTYLRGGVIAGYLRLIFRGWMPRMPIKGEDVNQLGGDFILDEQRRLIFAYPSRVPTDRPTVATLIDVLADRTAP